VGTSAQEETLVRSACSSNLRAARRLLATDPRLAQRDLATACVCGEAAYVARRLEHHPELARLPLPPFGWEPILYACFSRLPREAPECRVGVQEVTRLLLAAGADPNASFDHEGWLQVPLYGAAGIGNDAELTRILLEAGADPNDAGQRKVGEALYHASEFEDPACAALLIDGGTEPAVITHCLGRALNFPNEAMVRAFCERGARPRPAHLRQAVFRRRPVTTIELLLDAGATADKANKAGFTALRIAARWGDDDTAALLVARGADQSFITDEDRELGAYVSGAEARPPAGAEGLNALAEEAISMGNVRLLALLLDAGVPVDGDPTAEFTPLGQAAWRGRPAAVRELVDRGAKLRFDDGGSAIGATLHGLRHCQHPEGGPTMQTIDEIAPQPYADIARFLLSRGAPVPDRMHDVEPDTPATLLAELGIDDAPLPVPPAPA
jgi:ankyrin repeat protein